MQPMSNQGVKWLKLICKALFAGIGIVQCVYAILWAIANGNNVQDFYDTALYISNAELLISDGWRLAGYSVFIRFFMLFEGVFGVSYVVLLYLTQACIALICFAEGIRSISRMISGKVMKFSQAILPAIYILTVPIIWQMQFAILPDALALSLVVLLFAKILQLQQDPKQFCWNCLPVIFGALLLLGVLHRHYFYGAWCLLVIEAVVLLFRQIGKKHRIGKAFWASCVLILFAIFTPIMVKAVNNAVPKEDVYATYSIEADLLSRFVYPNLSSDFYAYSEEIKSIIEGYTIPVAGGAHEYYMNGIGPMIENSNLQEAPAIYREMVETGWILHKEEFAKNIVKETVSYLLMPIAMVKYMYYSGVSLYGHNYTKMYEMEPILTAEYMHVSMNGLLAVCILGIMMYLFDFFADKEAKKQRVLTLLHGLVSIVCVTVPLMLFAVARFDYRIGLFSTFIWAGFSIVTILEHRSKGDNCGQEEND